MSGYRRGHQRAIRWVFCMHGTPSLPVSLSRILGWGLFFQSVESGHSVLVVTEWPLLCRWSALFLTGLVAFSVSLILSVSQLSLGCEGF